MRYLKLMSSFVPENSEAVICTCPRVMGERLEMEALFLRIT